MEILLYLGVFLLLSILLFNLLGINQSINESIKNAKVLKRKKQMLTLPKGKYFKGIRKLSRQRKAMIDEAQMPLLTYYVMTVLSIASGMLIARVFFRGKLFVVLVGIMGAFVPLLFLQIQRTKNKNSRIEKLRSSMMILSGSYIVTEDFLKSVQDNLELLEYPKPFRNFLTYCSFIDGNIKIALRRLESEVDNVYFSQWIDVLIMAQDDRQLKYVTMSVLDSMNDVAQAQMESDTAIFAVWREYFMVLALIFSAPIIFKVLMPQAYMILVTSLIGKSLLVLLLIAVVFSVVRALKLNKPILM